MDVQQVLEFATALCEDARGNLAKMNRIGANKALKFYLDNVVMLRTVEPQVFAACYPDLMEEIDSIREAAVKAEEAATEHVNQGDRIAALEVKMDKLTAALEKFMENAPDVETVEEPEPAPRKRKAAKSQAEEPADPAAETDAEEAEEAAEDTD